MPESQSNDGRFNQRINFTFAADLAMIVAMVTLCVWVGRQAEKIDTLGKRDGEQTQAIQEVSATTSKMSGQVLQMTSAADFAEVERRVAVNESKIESQEQFQREMKLDMVQRLQRIEAKIDQGR